MILTDRGIFDLSAEINATGYIPAFHLEKDNDYLPRNKKNEKLKGVGKNGRAS